MLESPLSERLALRQGPNHVGRSRENDIMLATDNQVSRYHATITWDGYNCTIIDLVSSNGTFINGERLDPKVPRLLRDGDRVEFGHRTCFVMRLPQ